MGAYPLWSARNNRRCLTGAERCTYYKQLDSFLLDCPSALSEPRNIEIVSHWESQFQRNLTAAASSLDHFQGRRWIRLVSWYHQDVPATMTTDFVVGILGTLAWRFSAE